MTKLEVNDPVLLSSSDYLILSLKLKYIFVIQDTTVTDEISRMLFFKGQRY